MFCFSYYIHYNSYIFKTNFLSNVCQEPLLPVYLKGNLLLIGNIHFRQLKTYIFINSLTFIPQSQLFSLSLSFLSLSLSVSLSLSLSLWEENVRQDRPVWRQNSLLYFTVKWFKYLFFIFSAANQKGCDENLILVLYLNWLGMIKCFSEILEFKN